MQVRLRFSKLGKVRWTSHRDVARIWERGLRRVEVPVAYTEGFSPRPKLAFGLALSTGHESLGEYLDVEVTRAVDLMTLPERLSPALPTGIECMAGIELQGREPSLQQDVTTCRWEIELAGVDAATAAAAVATALAAPTLVITRTRKGNEVTDDVRPAIAVLTASGEGEAGAIISAEVVTQPAGCGRASSSTPASPAPKPTGCYAPTNGSSATARAGSPSRSTRRRFRTRCERAHEKGTNRCPTSWRAAPRARLPSPNRPPPVLPRSPLTSPPPR